jgi:hypothetical protein
LVILQVGQPGTEKEPIMTIAAARQAPAPVLYKIPEVMAMLRMSRRLVYEQIRAGRLRVVKQGRATFVTASGVSD